MRAFRGAAVVSMAVLPLTLAAPARATPPGPVLRYTFAQETGTTVTDRSPGHLDGTLVGTSAPRAYVKGLAGRGKALRLVGAQHQWIDVGDAPALDVDRYTIAAWVRYTGVENDGTLGRWEVLEKAGAYWLNIRTTGQVRAGGFYGGCDSRHWVWVDTPGVVPVNTWTHLAATYDGTRLRVYVGGVQVVSRAATGRTCSDDEPLAVGAKNAPAKGLLEAFFDGDLDEVRLYPRALTAAQVAALAR